MSQNETCGFLGGERQDALTSSRGGESLWTSNPDPNYHFLVDIYHIMVNNKTMLEGIFGNKTAEKVLLHIYHYGESYPSAISRDLKIANNPVVKQLDRFEKAQILSAKVMGRTRIYKFNERFPLTSPVKELIKRVYESIPLKQREQMFANRRRPRARGKPVL